MSTEVLFWKEFFLLFFIKDLHPDECFSNVLEIISIHPDTPETVCQLLGKQEAGCRGNLSF